MGRVVKMVGEILSLTHHSGMNFKGSYVGGRNHDNGQHISRYMKLHLTFATLIALFILIGTVAS